jgi:hypothetical protein
MKMVSSCEIEACGAPQGLSNSTFFSDVDQACEGHKWHLYILSDNFRQAGTTQLTDVRLWGGGVVSKLMALDAAVASLESPSCRVTLLEVLALATSFSQNTVLSVSDLPAAG